MNNNARNIDERRSGGEQQHSSGGGKRERGGRGGGGGGGGTSKSHGGDARGEPRGPKIPRVEDMPPAPPSGRVIEIVDSRRVTSGESGPSHSAGGAPSRNQRRREKQRDRPSALGAEPAAGFTRVPPAIPVAGGHAATSPPAPGHEPTRIHHAHPPMSVPHGEAEARKPSEAVSAAYITDKRFADLPISPLSIRAMNEVLKYQYMTHVQSMCIPPIQSGIDCLAKSKTGTGKTLAFLIPAIESILQRPARVPLSILVLSPTRELALQISKEAEALLTFHRGTKVVTVVGGTNINSDKNRLAGDVTILVATPGRLIDHIDNTTGFAAKLASIKVLVLDEADRLLDMGFKPSIDRILAALPNKSARQTLLFSATIPKGVLDIAANAMRPGYATINTTGTDDDSGQTHLHVHQELVTVPFEDLIPAIGAVLDQQMKKFPNDFKIIVFFTTARMTGFMAQIFGDAGIDVLEIHSRKSQGHRTSTSERFKNGKRMVLFSSDVTARGMDYPDVTFVLQVGLTDKEQYIHRLGRTARAGKEGCGMIMLYPFEESNMLHELRDLPIHRIDTAAIGLDAFRSRYATLLASSMRNPARIREAEQAYVAWMGFYNSCLRRVGFDKVKLVQMANTFATIIGLTEQPTLLKKTVGMMGLKGVPGLKIA